MSSKYLDKDDGIALILGDNIYHGANDVLNTAFFNFNSGATVFGYQVDDPTRYGVIEIDGDVIQSIEENLRSLKVTMPFRDSTFLTITR